MAFDERAAEELVYRTKRAGHVTSKMRFQSAQLMAYLSDRLCLAPPPTRTPGWSSSRPDLALLGVEFGNWPDVNMLFAHVDDAAADQLEAAGLLFYRMGRGTIRLVTSWQTTAQDVEQALAAFDAARLTPTPARQSGGMRVTQNGMPLGSASCTQPSPE